jgi:hypothetical protein
VEVAEPPRHNDEMRKPDSVTFRYRKAVRVGPFRATLSRSGVSYSAGAGEVRVTRRAGRRGAQVAFRTPIPGLSFIASTTTTQGGQVGTGRRAPAGLDPELYDALHASDAVPPPRGMKARRLTVLAGAVLVLAGLAFPLLLIAALPLLVIGGVSLVRNFRNDKAWFDQHWRIGR